jgi:hypothetical protein
MRNAIWLLVLVSVLGASSCAHPQYWVKGLTLPPGSTEKSRTETKTEDSNAKPKPWEQPDGTLMVYFDSSSTWDEVAAHISDDLKQQGFAEKPNPMAEIASKLPKGGLLGKGGLGGELVKNAADSFLNTSHTYTKDGSDYTVTLTNMKSFTESKIYSQIKKFRKNPDAGPKGDYLLLVMKRKGLNDSSSKAPEFNIQGK